MALVDPISLINTLDDAKAVLRDYNNAGGGGSK